MLMSFNSVWFNSVSFNSMSFNSEWFAHFVPADVSTLLVACTQFLPSLYSKVILTGKREPLPCSFHIFTSHKYIANFNVWSYLIYLTSFQNYCEINKRHNIL